MISSREGRALPPSSPYAGDDGSAPAALAAALSRPEQERLPAVVAALAGVRVLVPVVAQVEEMAEPDEHGVAGEKSASAAMVTVAAPDGRAATPVFSSLDALHRWRSDARPIPVEGPRAALASVSDADGLVVLDPGGPVTVLLPRPAVWALARQRTWVPAIEDPEVRAAVGRAVAAVPEVGAIRVEPGRQAEIRVVLGLPAGLARERVEELLAAASRVLAADETVTERVDSLELAVRALS
ncbi:SseB family protein [Ruania suaedae]|uniref:SseB family protein n=1 Tax=Ruania suaedae TaxID=2897774 RepID=UPI001E4A6430|nr:SseB family protein [Ruania suaedae]UFU04254.1 SseB family protein [Ruania suaedae]